MIQKKYILVSKIAFYSSLFASLLVILTVPVLGIFSVILLTILMNVASIIMYNRSLIYEYKFTVSKQVFKDTLRVSLLLTFATLSYGSFKYSERILILTYLNKEALGYYSLAIVIVDQLVELFKAAVSVRIQDIYEGLGARKLSYVHRMVIRDSSLILVGSCLLIPIVWLIFP